MTKKHCHEIEVKYNLQSDKVEKIAEVLLKLGFTFKSKAKLIDRWLPTGTRLREQKTASKESKYEIAKKKTIKKDGGLKNKCENEKKIDTFIKTELLSLAHSTRRALPTVTKTRTSWTVTIKGRDYTAVIDRVTKLGKFNGFYFELETLVPFDVDDPTAEADVEALATKILAAAYKGSKSKPTKVLLSYRKMALIHQAKQRRDKRAKAKLKFVKPKAATYKHPHQCS